MQSKKGGYIRITVANFFWKTMLKLRTTYCKNSFQTQTMCFLPMFIYLFFETEDQRTKKKVGFGECSAV